MKILGKNDTELKHRLGYIKFLRTFLFFVVLMIIYNLIRNSLKPSATDFLKKYKKRGFYTTWGFLTIFRNAKNVGFLIRILNIRLRLILFSITDDISTKNIIGKSDPVNVPLVEPVGYIWYLQPNESKLKL